jgi:large subunit ribosomal protein L10
MAISRIHKEEQVALLSKELGGAGHVVLLDFQGLDVPQITELRHQIRSATAQYRVVKNRLAKLAPRCGR